MKNKKLFKLSAIILGLITLCSFNKVQAVESVFGDTTLTRSDIQAYTTTTFSNSTTLKISKERESGNWYVFNPTADGFDENGKLIEDKYGNVKAQKVWKIAEVSSNERDYSNLYYCLNVERGFGLTNGEMAQNSEDNYTSIFDMKNSTDKTSIIQYAGGKLADKYNQVLWILENSYIPTGEADYQKATQYIELMQNAGININSDERLNLTEDEIDVVQQMAIWHFTNSNNSNYSSNNLPSLYLNRSQLSSIHLYTTIYGEQITGEKRQEKAEKLYKYFITENTVVTPTLELSNTNAEITESGDYYIAGEFELTKSNISITDLKVKLNNTELSSTDYLIVSSTSSNTNITEYNNLNKFYLKINKDKINADSTIAIDVIGKYTTKELTFLTDASDAANTQPVVLVKEKEESKSTSTDIDIELTQVSVEKVWEDNDNQDDVRPDSVKIRLYKDGKQYSDIILNSSNNWTYTWSKLLYGDPYTVKELNASNLDVENNSKYDANYTTTYSIADNKTTITNTYIPETISISGLKTWEDNKNQDGKRPENITVNLLANGKEIKELVVNENNNWAYEFTNLPKYENGEEIVYTITEDIVNEYTTTIEGYNITNKYTPGKISLKVIKQWDDQENQDEIRPNHVIVKLYKTVDGVKEEVSTQRLDENNNWMHIWTELDEKYNGTPILYSIEENPVEEYTTTYSSQDYSDTNEITITNSHVPAEITGKYNIVLRKVDENGNILNGSTFEVNGTEYELPEGEVTILENADIISEADIPFTYSIKETTIPQGYNGIQDTVINIRAKVKKEENNYRLTGALLEDEEGNTITDENISVIIEGDSIVIIVKNTPIEKVFDLALRKFITKINDIEYFRSPIVDTSTISTTGTATYKHVKQPIAVQKGDVVTYTIRVYNEGELDGYVDKITDYVPENLIPLIIGTEGIDEEKYAEEIDFNLNWGWVSSLDGKSVTTMKTAKVNSDTYSLIEGYEEVIDTKLDAYVEGSDKLDYIDVQIKCLVADTATSYEYLTNIAEITESQDINGVQGDGIDSSFGNVDYSNLSDYKNNEAMNSTTNSYIAGQEDDDDFEKLVVKEFDLSLRKFITKVNEVMYARVPVVDTSKLGTVVNGKTITTATYNHSKAPVIVKTGDLVTYTIRVYNEGTLEGFANEITDNIPEGLEFLTESDINKQYNWKMLDSEGNEITDISKAVKIVTNYLSDADANNIINHVSEENGVKTLAYKDVEVQFKVVAEPKNLEDNIIINEAQISSDSDRDIDSNPNRDEKYDYINSNNEDDIDYEPIKLQYFDLALRKFITKVNNTDYNNRYPEIKYNEDGSITYNHTKDPVLVTTDDVVVYTIRVYNEGEKAGYATEIKDNLPEGLAFDPANEINKQYNWKMLDSEGNVTEDASKVVAFSTDYLKDEPIDAFIEENEKKILSYKDVQIAFKVVESNTSDRILVNTAEISNDSDDDIDSIPNNNIETEDDLDKEYVRVQYFDLSLKKWVTRTEVTYNGKTTTTKTGFDEDSDSIAKVDLVASKMTKTAVKFAYNIKVTNEGELPGYAYEIKDYIPKGLKFVAEDNKDWKELDDGTVVTEKLKDTLLNPGESATVEIVLTWKNSTTNTGLKTNYAEISKDSAEDKDSIPDNYDFTEDDIDDAQVILSIKTAGAPTYIGLIFATVAILAGGIFLIKKYVID